MAVVAPDLTMHGVMALRVADASIMPRAVSGTPHAAGIMIAAKAAGMCLGSGEMFP